MTDAAEIFPPAPRVIFDAAPLTEVICQLRFPPILKIEQTPAEFQDKIRGKFPLFERVQNVAFPPDVPAEVLQAIAVQMQSNTYQFKTEDQKTTLALNPEAISLSTRSYERWETFKTLLGMCLGAFREVYHPSFYTRAGLRYRNAIHRDRLGLQDHSWADLLSDAIVGELALPGFEANIQSAQSRLLIRLPEDHGAVFLQHGLGQPKAGRIHSYVVDFDFHKDGKIEVHDAEPTLDYFNRRAGWAFQWSIKPRLHGALRPRAISD